MLLFFFAFSFRDARFQKRQLVLVQRYFGRRLQVLDVVESSAAIKDACILFVLLPLIRALRKTAVAAQLLTICIDPSTQGIPRLNQCFVRYFDCVIRIYDDQASILVRQYGENVVDDTSINTAWE